MDSAATAHHLARRRSKWTVRNVGLAKLNKEGEGPGFVCCASDSSAAAAGRQFTAAELAGGAELSDCFTSGVVRAVSVAAAAAGKPSGRVLHAAASADMAEHFQTSACHTTGRALQGPWQDTLGSCAVLQLVSSSSDTDWGLQLY